jgi:hypothetical protein
MLTWIGRGVATALLLAQMAEPSLETDYLRLKGSAFALVTLIAVHVDGTPVRGFIRCDGEWFKYADEEDVLWGVALPFKTDARGAVVMNPHLDIEQLHCWSEDRGMRGDVTVDLSDTHIETIVLNRKVTQ